MMLKEHWQKLHVEPVLSIFNLSQSCFS
uniref:Uncharacterized protein n=1 Tax=Rhizophora mucronata TaxID=61149 RepID=A0A2P2NJG9_RHIMU